MIDHHHVEFDSDQTPHVQVMGAVLCRVVGGLNLMLAYLIHKYLAKGLVYGYLIGVAPPHNSLNLSRP